MNDENYFSAQVYMNTFVYIKGRILQNGKLTKQVWDYYISNISKKSNNKIRQSIVSLKVSIKI